MKLAYCFPKLKFGNTTITKYQSQTSKIGNKNPGYVFRDFQLIQLQAIRLLEKQDAAGLFHQICDVIWWWPML